ncbi:hypothetical protein GGR26_002574 [Lewinella marina]|uniref:Uncharacterized protein n=1 Tax=Neolewinella marina TaxID=438751 RepID=A0A2G0CB51_9BACT|nr:hypothetical protein [Neolewinella marina]NJB86797.1 hypothetical protein [Neolewinella marina]PHK97191.1 hypothetical protein CGL56_17270 [Neolewinella marina]
MSTHLAQHILKDDPRFAEVPDFRALRELGIAHIAALSSDLWTDHNLHDPGITLLELLCYALTDLGYRTSLGEAQLFAPAMKGEPDGNFFTPAEILTNNPVTLLDYRKMLVDVPGVRNAWIEKVEEQEVPLAYRVPTQENCAPRPLHTRIPAGEQEAALRLKGLYRVLLDIDPRLTAATEACSGPTNTFGATLAEVGRRLHAHRNLCEDFVEIAVLRDEEIGFCLDLDLDPKADPATVLGEVFTAIENFISPRVRFASLKSLLAEGRPIEAIFRGRPYLPAYAAEYGLAALSHGFVDTEQLEQLHRPTVLRASDLYRVIMNVAGVRAIRELKLASFLDARETPTGADWVLPLTPDHRPLFAPERGKYTIHKGPLLVPFDAAAVINRFRQRLGDYRKTTYAHAELDVAIPYGKHRGDLIDYYSIQHELPVTYGVGEGDLSAEAPAARKAQVLQLRGFLTFFDQFLANYCAQLFHTRSIYSWLPGTNKTLFAQPVAGAPGGADLLRFPPNTTPRTGATPALVRSLVYYDHPLNRDQAVASLVNTFQAMSLDTLRSRLRVEEAADGTFHFALDDALGRPLLRGEEDYQLEASALEAGERVVLQLIYQGGLAENYRSDNYPADHRYTFTILDGTTDYGRILDGITERPHEFARNRNLVLDHLLARFNEQFTDYVLLMYALNREAPDPNRIIGDKEAFLADYPRISRERGKGFDYRHPDLPDNRSGLEQRVGSLMGLRDGGPKDLNPFSVHLRDQQMRLVWYDHRGRVVLRTHWAYPLTTDREGLADRLLQRLAQPAAYRRMDCPEEGIYRYQLVDEEGLPLADFPVTHPSADARDEHLACVQAFFGEVLSLHVVAHRTASDEYGFELHGEEYSKGVADIIPFWRSAADYPSRGEALRAGRALRDGIRRGAAKITNVSRGKQREYGLKVKAGSTSALSTTITDSTEARKALREQLISYHAALLPDCPGLRLRLKGERQGFFFSLLGPDGTVWLRTPGHFSDPRTAEVAGLHLMRAARDPKAYRNTAEGRYGFTVVGSGGEEVGVHPLTYATEAERDGTRDKVQTFFSGRQFDYRLRQAADRFVWCLTAGESGATLRGEVPFADAENAAAHWRLVRKDLLTTAYWRTREREDQTWWLEVERADGLLLAGSGPFATEVAAYAARTKLREWIGLGIPGGEGVEKLPGTWSYHLYLEGREVLHGTENYPDETATDLAFLALTKLAGEPDNYRDRPDPDGCLFSFDVVDERGVVARHPEFYPEETARDLRDRVMAHVQENTLACRIGYREYRWTYCLDWEDCSGCCGTLLSSMGADWDTPVAAKAAVKKLLALLRSGVALADWTNGEWYSFGVSEGGEPIAEHPREYPTMAERDRVRNDARAYLEAYFGRCERGESGFTMEDELYVHCKSIPVCCTNDEAEEPTAAGADCILSAYRLSAAAAVAEHPLALCPAAERDALVEEIQGASQRGELEYVEFSVAGTQVPFADQAPGTTGLARYHYAWSVNGLPPLRSVRSFASEAEALAGFEADLPELLAVAGKAKNYASVSLGSFLDAHYRNCWPEAAGPFTDYRPGPFSTAPYLVLHGKTGWPLVYSPGPEDAGTTRRGWQDYALHYPFRYVAGRGWRYHLIEPGGTAEWLRSTRFYSSRLEARRAFGVLLELLRFPPNYRTDDRPEAGIFRLEIIETLLEAAVTYADAAPVINTETPCWVICPATYHHPRYTIGEDSWPVLSDCPEVADVDPLCPRAWGEGLETFLLYGTDARNYYDFLDGAADCCHGFRVVKPGYRVARNPRESHTSAEREALMNWLNQYGNCRLDKEEQPYQQCVSFGAGVYRPALRAADGTIHWLATARFEDPEKANAYWKEQMIALLGYAREPDYYQPRKTEPDAEGNMQYRLEVLDDDGSVVLESQQSFVRETLAAAARERIALARQFPIYVFREAYGFMCYSAGKVPDFQRPSDSPCLPADLEPASAPQWEEAETTLFNGLLELQVMMPGEVIWESSEEFGSPEAAWSAYRCFLRLLADRRNYQRIQLADCNLFGIELTRPDHVLAEHPRRYPGVTTLEEARQGVLARVNGEGMRLVEHLLLRPRVVGDATIPNICPAPPPPPEETPEGCPNRDQWAPSPAAEELNAPKTGLSGQPEPLPELPYVPGADPYSYWATIVLPYWPYRFQNINFRAFFADTLRREAPAHVALKICWLDPKQMRDFTLRYRRWLQTLGWEDACDRSDAQKDLIDFLDGMTSVYPPARLQSDDCEAGGVTDPGAVLLGSTQLS